MAPTQEDHARPFSFEEYTDMLLCYGKANKNSREASRIYAEMYPDRRLPSPHTIVATYKRSRDKGYTAPKSGTSGHWLPSDKPVVRFIDSQTGEYIVARRNDLR
ncbi:hypothetical protein TKK_0012056 [Trichogramma kaykai]